MHRSFLCGLVFCGLFACAGRDDAAVPLLTPVEVHAAQVPARAAGDLRAVGIAATVDVPADARIYKRRIVPISAPGEVDAAEIETGAASFYVRETGEGEDARLSTWREEAAKADGFRVLFERTTKTGWELAYQFQSATTDDACFAAHVLRSDLALVCETSDSCPPRAAQNAVLRACASARPQPQK
jgi:hypothetical protein